MRADEAEPLNDTLHVYPTALKAGAALREEARAAGALLGYRVTTFPQLTDALARDLGISPRVLEPEMAAVVLERALAAADVPAPFHVPRRGLVREALAVIGEFKAARLGPEEVAAIATALPAATSGARLAALARVYAAYEAGLRRLDALDRHGRDWLVCEGLAAAAAAGRWPRTLAGVRRIVFAEIYDFSVLQFLTATSLIRLVGDAELVAFAHPENVDATRFLDRTWNRFVGAEPIADQVLPSFVVRGGRRGSLAAALRGVFATDRPDPVPPDGSVRLVVASTRYGEVEAAARDIRLRLERREPPERIAVLARDMSVYGDLIEDVCRRFRIPVYFRKGKPLLANALVKALVNVLGCVVDGFPRARLEALVDTDYLRATRRDLLHALRATGFVAETARPLPECLVHQDALLALQAADARRTPEQRARLERQRATLAAQGRHLVELVDLLKGLDAVRTVGGHVAALRRVVRRLGFRHSPAEDLVATAARRDARAWTRVDETLTVLAGLSGALGVGRIPVRDFFRLLLAALETQEVEDPAEHAGSVRALSVLDARGLDFDTVYLLGLDDGTFPAPRSESPLLPDAMKREVNALAGDVLRRALGARAEGLPLGGLLRTAREASLEDPFLFFLALSMAERELVLSYPGVDERGNPTVRSPFVDEVAACLEGGLPTEVLDPTALVPAAAQCCEPAELVARAVLDRWRRGAGAAPDRLAPALREALPGGGPRLAAIDRRAVIEERRSRYFLTPTADGARKEALADAWVGRLLGDLGPISARLGEMRWSPTHLERLGRCGFKFFADRVLGLAEEDAPEIEVGAREQGTLFHQVLEDFFRAHPELPADREAARALGREFLRGARAVAVRAIAPKHPAFLELSWSRLETALDELIVLEHEAQRARAAAGLTVERQLEEPFEFVLDDPGSGSALRIHGKPDRLEILRRGPVAEALRVIDYKASRNRAKYAPLLDPEKELGRTGFQVPVYLLGALAAGVPGVNAATRLEGGFLLLLAPPEDKPLVREFPRVLLEGAPGAITERIRELVAAARAGRFDVNPRPCDPWCPYRTVCRYQPPPLEDDAEGGGG